MIRSSSFKSSVQRRKVKLTVALSSGQALANGRAFVFGTSTATIFLLLLGSPVFALTNIATVVCGWAPTVGAIGTALAFVVFIGGWTLIAIGNRDGQGKTMWAVLGAVALFGAVGLFTALTGGTCGQASA